MSRMLREAWRISCTVCSTPCRSSQSAVRPFEIPVGGAAEQFARELDMPEPNGVEPFPARRVAPFGGIDQTEQIVGDAAAGREHDRLARGGIRFENVRDPPEAGGIRHARPAKLVHSPRFHDSLLHTYGSVDTVRATKKAITFRMMALVSRTHARLHHPVRSGCVSVMVVQVAIIGQVVARVIEACNLVPHLSRQRQQRANRHQRDAGSHLP